MLAKLWKKVLLAICIIACIFNIMSKLVNRTSLEANLKSANDGNVVFDFNSKKSTYQTPENTASNKSAENTLVQRDETEMEHNQETTNSSLEQDESSKTMKYTDFVVEF